MRFIMAIPLSCIFPKTLSSSVCPYIFSPLFSSPRKNFPNFPSNLHSSPSFPNLPISLLLSPSFSLPLKKSDRMLTNPPSQTESAREARKSFYCELCGKGYARMNEFEAHEGSYDHLHTKVCFLSLYYSCYFFFGGELFEKKQEGG